MQCYMPAFGRKKACNIYARLSGKATGQGCRSRLPGKAAGQGCRARLPGKVYHQGITEEGGEGQGSAGVATTCTKSQSCETQRLLNTFYLLMVEEWMCVSYEKPTTLLLLRRKQL
jgi:hypothetical protein